MPDDRKRHPARPPSAARMGLSSRPPIDDPVRRSEQAYRLMFERNRLPMWVTDAGSLAFLAVNDAAVEHYGYSRQEFLALTLADIQPGQDDSAPTGVRRHLRKDGTEILVEVNSHTGPWEERTARFTLLIDVTWRERAMAGVREAEARYRSLVEHMPAVTYIDDRFTGRGVYISPQVESMLGYSREEWLSDPDLWIQIAHPEDRARVSAEYRRALDAGRAWVGEVRLLGRDGRSHWFEEVAVVLPDETGAPRYIQGVMLDVTEARLAGDPLRESERRMREMLENVQLAAVSVNAAGKITFCNDFLLRLTGWTREEVLGEDWLEMFVPSELIDVREGFHREMSAGKVAPHREHRIRTRDGASRLLSFSNSVLKDPEGRVIGATSIGQDITERRRAEEELRRNVAALSRTMEQRRLLLARLQRAQEDERQRIAEDIHDDSIQAMAAVSMRVSSLRMRQTDPEITAALSEVELTVDEAISRLRHLLFELRPSALDREGLAVALGLYLDTLRDELGIESQLINSLREEPPVALRTVVYRIAQEALVNVRKHSGATRVVVQLESREGGVQVEIRDNGRGFDIAEAARPLPGHLGFSAMRERAEMAGGWFRVHSGSGGTTVEFWVPVGALGSRTS
jgi:PAS domain S-box-containing protein